MNPEELDRKFDDGEDVLEFFDQASLKRPGLETQPLDIDFPLWMIEALDREAQRLGIDRKAVVKVWIAERLDKISA